MPLFLIGVVGGVTAAYVFSDGVKRTATIAGIGVAAYLIYKHKRG